MNSAPGVRKPVEAWLESAAPGVALTRSKETRLVSHDPEVKMIAPEILPGSEATADDWKITAHDRDR